MATPTAARWVAPTEMTRAPPKGSSSGSRWDSGSVPPKEGSSAIPTAAGTEFLMDERTGDPRETSLAAPTAGLVVRKAPPKDWS